MKEPDPRPWHAFVVSFEAAEVDDKRAARYARFGCDHIIRERGAAQLA
jgi:hypothetical protein